MNNIFIKDFIKTFIVSIMLLPILANAEFKVPALTGPVVDTANAIGAQDASYIVDVARALNEKGLAQLTVVTLNSLEGNAIEQVGIQIADKWKLGGAKTDNGLIIIAAIQERKLRIEVGQGLEGIIPDIIAKRIIEDEIVPMARSSGLSKGLVAGVEKIYYSLAEPGSTKAQPTVRKKRESGFGSLGFIILIILFGFIRLLGGRGSRSRGGLLGAAVGYGIGSSIGRSTGRGGFGGGSWGGGGGGFSGGGASGGW